jgi:hypothetical protein
MADARGRQPPEELEMRSVFLILLYLLSATSLSAKEKPPVTYRIPLPPKPDFSPLEWLLGEWTGKTTGRGPQGEIRLSITYDLDKRVMVLREQVSLPATATVSASEESWMGILSADRSGTGLVLRTYSSTGFITRHRVSVEEEQVSFNPEGGEQPPPGWLVRRTLERSGEAELIETVQMAPPNRSFFDYYTAKLTRKETQ